MKKLTVLWLATVVLLSGCSGSLSLIKRKYNGGYYIAVSGKNQRAKSETRQGTSVAAAPAHVRSVNVPQMERAETINPELNTSPVQNALPFALKISEKTSHSTTPAQLSASALKAPAGEQVSTVRKIQPLQAVSKKGSSDANLIIMIILCFFPFINLIPVYLHDGKSITLNFWFTLIGDLLVFVPGIVFALLVVLDLIDLR
jgi:hypothetical protein